MPAPALPISVHTAMSADEKKTAGRQRTVLVLCERAATQREMCRGRCVHAVARACQDVAVVQRGLCAFTHAQQSALCLRPTS